MYGVFTYIWVVLGVNVGKYTIHWASGYINPTIGLMNLPQFFCSFRGTAQSVKLETLADCAAIFPRSFLREGRKQRKHRKTSQKIPSSKLTDCNGNPPLPIGNTSSHVGFSVAMLVYQRVDCKGYRISPSFGSNQPPNWQGLGWDHQTSFVFLAVNPGSSPKHPKKKKGKQQSTISCMSTWNLCITSKKTST